MGIVPIFHENRLKKFVPGQDPNRVQVLRPDPEMIQEEQEFEVSGILDHRIKRTKGRVTKEYLVMWKGLNQCENTWEPEWHLENAKDILVEYKEQVGLEK
jgi:hypothetical protein